MSLGKTAVCALKLIIHTLVLADVSHITILHNVGRQVEGSSLAKAVMLASFPERL